MTQHHEVEPTRTTLAASNSAELMPNGDERLAEFIGRATGIGKFGGERARTHACGVGLGNTHYARNIARADASTSACATSDGV